MPMLEASALGVESTRWACAAKQTSAGRLRVFLLADVNVIDFEALRLFRPEAIADLPAGGKRLVQRAEGYRYTVKPGQVTFEDGVHTGALPGGLARGGREAVILPMAAE